MAANKGVVLGTAVAELMAIRVHIWSYRLTFSSNLSFSSLKDCSCWMERAYLEKDVELACGVTVAAMRKSNLWTSSSRREKRR